ncbi:hypothetical protein ElyMa_003217400 [Elysia marginata]|uniref:Uncharacterized protein n=1 Tax=Elysia marginata TaxID=1093978 RepID=A0AAV4J2Q7_9GAST|nr:hypothetical protein ElyMa_003217400 [Elysia marginata]
MVVKTLKHSLFPNTTRTPIKQNICQFVSDSTNTLLPLETVERFKFFETSQETIENITDFIAAIKRLSELWGCSPNHLKGQVRVLSPRLGDSKERDLTFEGATNLALSMEMANQHAQDMQFSADKSVHKSNHKLNYTGLSRHLTLVKLAHPHLGMMVQGHRFLHASLAGKRAT